MVGRYLVFLVAVVACRPDDSVVAPETTTERTAESAPAANDTEPAPTGDDCVSPVEDSVVQDRYTTGLAKLEESRDGEHFVTGPFEEAMGALAFAAENGHLEAQSLYGRTMFSTLFMGQAPQPDEQDQYVVALKYLRIAAKAGDELARGYLPGLEASSPASGEPPLSDLPAGWLHIAYARADEWIECHGLPKPR